MAFFDKLGKKIEGMVQDAQEYTSDFIEINKLNTAIRSERDAISGLQKNIGILMQERYKSGEDVPDAIRPDLVDILSRQEKIASLEARIEEAKRKERAAQAPGARQAAETEPAGSAAAAPTEADSVIESPATPDEAVSAGAPASGDSAPARRRFCTNCGEPLVAGKPFCGNCGYRNE